MLGPVTCAACGAKVREDRTRCLRCGEPLRPREETPAPRRVPTLAVAAGLAALGIVVILVIARPAPDAAPPPVAAAPPPAAAPVVTPAPVDPEADDARATAPIFVSRDISRDGLAAYSRGDVAGSLEQFQAAVDADPRNPDALNNLGQLLVRSGRARDAIPYFDRAIEIANGVWAYHFNRARALAQLEQWNAAAAGYRSAAALFPDDYVTHFNLAKALEADGELADAIAAYERAIALAPAEPDFHLSHAHALELAKRPVDAVAAYRRYLELQENAPQAEKIKARIAQLTAS